MGIRTWIYFWIFLFNFVLWRSFSLSIVMSPKLIFLLIVEFQWFLIELSVLPGKRDDILAHLFPYIEWALSRILSSSWDHLSFFMSGLRWLCHLSQHCLPILPGKTLEIYAQFLAPFYRIIFYSSRSSFWVQVNFIWLLS